ncbi:MAG: hypothetical protein ACR2FU_03880, partial [Streptosporangiaceae bacterium]
MADLGDRMSDLVLAGYVRPDSQAAPDQAEALTDAGRTAYQRIFAAREARIALLLDGWQPEQHPRLRELLGSITHELAASREQPGPDLDRSQTPPARAQRARTPRGPPSQPNHFKCRGTGPR